MNTQQPAADFQLRNLTFDQSCQLLKTLFSHEVNPTDVVVMTGSTSVLISLPEIRVEIEMDEKGNLTCNPTYTPDFAGDRDAITVDRSAEMQKLIEEWGLELVATPTGSRT